MYATQHRCMAFKTDVSRTKMIVVFQFVLLRITIIISNQTFSLARDWSKRITWSNNFPAKTGDYPRLVYTTQVNCSFRAR